MLLRDALRSEIRQLPSNPTAGQKTAIEEKRQRLLSRIIKFHKSSDHFIGAVDLDNVGDPHDQPAFCLEENGADLDEEHFWQGHVESDEPSDDDEEDIFPESVGLWMPSSLGVQAGARAEMEGLAKEEMQLRIGHANDALEHLRTNLGQKSVLYRMHIRSSASVRTDTRSRKDIKRLTLKINRNVRTYHRARQAMTKLGASDDLLGKYQEIHPNHLTIEKEITEENRFGQGSHVLPWFWRVGGVELRAGSDWMDECKCLKFETGASIMLSCF